MKSEPCENIWGEDILCLWLLSYIHLDLPNFSPVCTVVWLSVKSREKCRHIWGYLGDFVQWNLVYFGSKTKQKKTTFKSVYREHFHQTRFSWVFWRPPKQEFSTFFFFFLPQSKHLSIPLSRNFLAYPSRATALITMISLAFRLLMQHCLQVGTEQEPRKMPCSVPGFLS